MEIIILISGSLTGLLISKTKKLLAWDMVFGGLGALAIYVCFLSAGFIHMEILTVMAVLMSAVIIIYISRSLQNLPLV